MTFGILYIDLPGSLIPVLVRVVYVVSLVALVITRGRARRVGRHLTTAWVKQGVE